MKQRKKDAKKGFGGIPGKSENFKKWGHSSLGPWSLPRGRGVWLGTGHALRSKRGGGSVSRALFRKLINEQMNVKIFDSDLADSY